MKALKGLLAYTVNNDSLYSGKHFIMYKTKRQKWNSQRRFSK